MELSDKTVKHVQFLVQQHRVVHLLHVLPSSISSLYCFAADIQRVEEQMQKEAMQQLQETVKHNQLSVRI